MGCWNRYKSNKEKALCKKMMRLEYVFDDLDKEFAKVLVGGAGKTDDAAVMEWLGIDEDAFQRAFAAYGAMVSGELSMDSDVTAMAFGFGSLLEFKKVLVRCMIMNALRYAWSGNRDSLVEVLFGWHEKATRLFPWVAFEKPGLVSGDVAKYLEGFDICVLVALGW